MLLRWLNLRVQLFMANLEDKKVLMPRRILDGANRKAKDAGTQLNDRQTGIRSLDRCKLSSVLNVG